MRTPRPHTRKHRSNRLPPLQVVLCTNVAETSLTVDDCCVVIDSGRQKSAEYDALNATSELALGWTPLASRKQRRGRAGRTRAGQYWALYSRATHRALPAHAPPEMFRVPLESLYLQVKVLGLCGGDARAALGLALEPPPREAVEVAARQQNPNPNPDPNPNPNPNPNPYPNPYPSPSPSPNPNPNPNPNQAAARQLRRLGAIAVDGASEALTPLGTHLARMPVDLRVGKMLLYG